MGLAELWKHWEVAKGYAKGVGKVLIAPGVFTYNATGSVIYRIESNGPFPHKKDGTVFQNKEGRLPQGDYR